MDDHLRLLIVTSLDDCSRLVVNDCCCRSRNLLIILKKRLLLLFLRINYVSLNYICTLMRLNEKLLRWVWLISWLGRLLESCIILRERSTCKVIGRLWWHWHLLILTRIVVRGRMIVALWLRRLLHEWVGSAIYISSIWYIIPLISLGIIA